MIAPKTTMPKGWQAKKLKDITTKISDGLHSTPQYVLNSQFYFINGNNLINDKITVTNITKCVSEEEYNRHKKNLNNSTILLSINGTIGNVAYYNGEKVILGKSAAYLNCSNDVNRSYIFYFLKTSKTQRHFIDELTGSTIKNLSLKSIKDENILLPYLSEQEKIVEVLEAWDSYLKKLTHSIKLKKKIKKGLMEKLLTGKIRLKGFNKSWQSIKLGELCDISRGGSPRPIEAFLTNDESGFNWLRIGDIEVGSRFIFGTKEKIIKEGLKKTTLVNPDDFILSNSMSFGRPYIMKIQACIHDGWLALKNLKKNIDKNYLYYKLSSQEVQNDFISLSAGSGVQNLKKETVSGLEINIPPIDEQTAIANILTTADRDIEALEKKKMLSEQQKKFLLNNLITGRIRLPEFTK